jgi:tetratricopeptide (TPR) repeat protein
LLLRVGGEDEETITHALDELWQRHVVREEGANLFDFTHDKLREVAYLETSLPKRRLLHRQIAQALEVIMADVLDDTSAQLAAHFEQAGLHEQAIPYYLRGGMTAARVYANDDAINLLTRALELLSYLPLGEKRDTQELALLLPLATLYRITKGWASPDLEHVANRMRALGDMVGSVAQRVQTLFLLQTVYIVGARFDQMLQTETELHQLLELSDSPPSPFMKVNFIGATLQSTGNFKRAQEQFEGMIAVRNDKSIRDLQVSQGVNYLALGHVWKSHALWCLGYPQKALEGCKEGMQVALEFAHPFSQAMTVTYFALLQELRSNAATFRAQADAAFAFTGDHKATYYQAWSNILVCYAEAQQQPNAGIQMRLRDAIRVFTETGARLRMPYYLSLLARVIYNARQFDEGLNTLEDALAESQKNNEHWWDAELHRLRGELIWSRGADADEVEAVFLHSIEIARSQQAKSLELRSATSLARLWRANSRSTEAKHLLVPVYQWFTEGFDTPDLQAAQELIRQL